MKSSINKQQLIDNLRDYWIVNLETKKWKTPKHFYFLTASSVYGVTNNEILIKYYFLNLIPRKTKINLKDVVAIRPKVKRKTSISDVAISELLQAKWTPLRKTLWLKTQMIKWSIIMGFFAAVICLALFATPAMAL